MYRHFFALVFLSAFILLVACGVDAPADVQPTTGAPTSSAPTAESALANTSAPASEICGPATAPEYLKDVVLAKATDQEYAPVDVVEEFEPTQKALHAVVTLENAPQDLALGAQWYVIQAAGVIPNSKLDNTQVRIPASPERNVDFSISTPEDTWPSGTYCVEIYAEGNLAFSRIFTIAPNATPSNATAAVLKQVVLAAEIDPGTFAPINPTNTFPSNAPSIYAAVQLIEAPANTRLRSRWYPPGQEPLESNDAGNVTGNGTRWFDFHLLPSADGFPAGEYKVEIYVNDQLAETKTFVVE